jgi:MFS transporter, DHA2 family, methylenomycin A resistance protein
MGGLTFGAIDAGADGLTAPRWSLHAVAVVALAAFLANQATFLHGLRTSLLLAATVALAAAAPSLLVATLRLAAR